MSLIASANSPTPPALKTESVPAIQTTGLRKQYGQTVVLHDLSLTVQPGEVFGFLGPNGAGKTTTIKILTGLVRATSGDARIFGSPVADVAVRRRLGYLPEHFRFHTWLTGNELLEFHGRLAGLSGEERRRRTPQALKRVGLAGWGEARLGSYSKGMTQRIGLAQALIHSPDLVLLDEPTSALDPVGRRDVRDLVRSLAAEGTTIFLNSHLLTEIEMVCDRVAIVDRGKVVGAGRLAELVGGVSELRVTVDRVDEPLLTALRCHARVLDYDAATIVLGVGELAVAPAIAELIVQRGYGLYGLVPVHRTLEDVFVGLVDGAGP